MNKNWLKGLVLSAIISSVFSGVVMADEIIPKVTVNDRSVNFYDQAPIVDENQEVFVPVRGIFEAMGATVQWREEDRSVYVKAKDNIKRMILKIDDPIIEQYTLTSLTTVDSALYVANKAPFIIDNRTMIPLDIITDAMGENLIWDKENNTINIITSDYQKKIDKIRTEDNKDIENEELFKDILANIYLEASTDYVKSGETFEVDVKLSNTEAFGDFKNINQVCVGIVYDSSKVSLEFQRAMQNQTQLPQYVEVTKPQIRENTIKYTYAPLSEEAIKITDGSIARFKFKSNTDEEFGLSLSDVIDTKIGFDIFITLDDDNGRRIVFDAADELYINSQAVTFNK